MRLSESTCRERAGEVARYVHDIRVAGKGAVDSRFCSKVCGGVGAGGRVKDFMGRTELLDDDGVAQPGRGEDASDGAGPQLSRDGKRLFDQVTRPVLGVLHDDKTKMSRKRGPET